MMYKPSYCYVFLVMYLLDLCSDKAEQNGRGKLHKIFCSNLLVKMTILPMIVHPMTLIGGWLLPHHVKPIQNVKLSCKGHCGSSGTLD